MAATNIGRRPTFAGRALSIEAHLLDFDRDIYGQQLELRFERRLRAERKFDSLAALVAQIKVDIAATRRWLGGPLVSGALRHHITDAAHKATLLRQLRKTSPAYPDAPAFLAAFPIPAAPRCRCF